ncbi:MAG: hypothetical protein JWM33_1513 [Caulobacteraceae bacterium]|nr:hypothetical protein [Caulobacteraceae bacterium]
MRTLRTPGLVQNAGLFLVALALALRVLIPGGYMVAAPKAGALPALVICTGHGPLEIGQSAGKGGQPAQQDTTDHPCTFAGGLGALAPPMGASLAAPALLLAAPILLRVLRDQQPGRGLAAPPPPTTGPPSIA